MAKRNSHSLLSTLAETTDEYIKLECARRRNQPQARRRSMLQEQFQVAAPVSRLKARLAQTRHHEFLMRKDNRAALNAIIDSVRELVEEASSSASAKPGVDSGNDSRRRSSAAASTGLNPMECARLLAWAADTERVLSEFEPSDLHENDPIVRIVEQLQQLQDGPVCLAEGVVDARALLERWDRSGVFDDQFDGDSSGSDRDDDADRSAPVARPTHLLNNSYAYQNIRQRAGANCIKRNVLRWVRSKESFCQRVSEIELFGRTTESLLKELTSTPGTTSALDMATDSPQDIFSVVRGRRVDRYANSIALADLMHFAKHVALFPVDQALRSLDVMARKRRLLDLRSVIKIQSSWRKARRVFQARRLFQAMELLQIEREQEAAALAEALALAKVQTPQKSGKRKSSKPATGKKIRNSLAILSASSASNSEVDSEANARSPSVFGSLASRVRASMMAARHEESKAVFDGNGAEGQLNGTPNGQRRQRTRERGGDDAKHHRNEDEDGPEDASDVVNAWEAFLDSVKAQDDDTPSMMKGDEPLVRSKADEPAGSFDPKQVATEVMESSPLLDEDDWRNWSEEEKEDSVLANSSFGSHSDDDTRQRTALDRPDTRRSSVDQRVPSRSMSREGSSRAPSATEVGASRRQITKQPTIVDERRATHRLSSIVSTADLIKRLEQRPRLDRPSVLVPFSDWSSVQGSSPSATIADLASTAPIRPPRYFHEMNFHQLYPGVEELHVVRSLIDAEVDDLDEQSLEIPMRLQQQGSQSIRPIISPPSIVSVNRIYRRAEQQQTARAFDAKQAQVLASDSKNTIEVATTDPAHEEQHHEIAPIATPPQHRASRSQHGPGLRIYRAPASLDRRANIVVKQTTKPKAEDSDAIHQQLEAHTQWIQTLDSRKSIADSSSTFAPIPPRHVAASRFALPRKRRVQSQHRKARARASVMEDSFGSRDESQTTRLAPALPRLRHSSVQSADPSELPGENSTSGLDDATPPTVIMNEVRRTLKFKTGQDSQSKPSNRPTPPSLSAQYSLDKTDSVRPPSNLSDAGRPQLSEDPPTHSDFDGRFDGSAVRSANQDAARKHKWYLPRRLSGPRVSSNKQSVTMEEAKDRVVSFREECDDINRGRQRQLYGGGSVVPLVGTRQAARPTTRPASIEDDKSVYPDSASTSARSTTARSNAASSVPRSTIPVVPAKQPNGTRAMRPKAQEAVATGAVSIPRESTAQSVDCTTAEPPSPIADPGRSAAFDKLLLQYLGLLQCSPMAVLKP